MTGATIVDVGLAAAVLVPVATALGWIGKIAIARHFAFVDRIAATNERAADTLAHLLERIERVEKAIGLEAKLDEAATAAKAAADRAGSLDTAFRQVTGSHQAVQAPPSGRPT